MTTDSERIERLERLVATLRDVAEIRGHLSPTGAAVDVLQVTTEQAAAVRKLLQRWIPLPPTSYGEFDPMDYLAANRGWKPLEIEEFMEVGIGDKRYKIHRVR